VDHKAQLREAYRVLKPGNRAAFTVWARRNHCLMFEIETMAKKKLGREVPVETRSNFDLGEDLQGLKAECEKVGFKSIKIWN